MLMIDEIFKRFLIKNRNPVNVNNPPKIYTGIGARNPKIAVQEIIKHISATLAKKDYILYSGGTPGCQTCFEKGCDENYGMKNIFTPWKGYNNSSSPLVSWGRKLTSVSLPSVTKWEQMAPEIRYIHIRNVQMLLGYNLDKPTKFVISWFPYLSYEYGTIMEYAKHFNIPVFNIFIATDLKYFLDHILSKA